MNDDPVGEKVCTRCGQSKPASGFFRQKMGRLGLASVCKSCMSLETKLVRSTPEYKLKRSLWRGTPEAKAKQAAYDASEAAKKRRSDAEKTATMKAYRRKYASTVERREVVAKQMRKRRMSPEVRVAEKLQRTTYRSMPENKTKRAAYMRDARKNNPIIRCIEQSRTMLRNTLLSTGNSKSSSTSHMLGYTPDELRKRIECQFRRGMGWHNRDEWHIDHKKPISAFVAQGITNPKTINSLCNLQPLWASENETKSWKWPAAMPANDNSGFADWLAHLSCC